jgi:hypothetical protein
METELMTIGERIARLIEAEADQLPASRKATADILRAEAENFRKNVTGKLCQPWNGPG